MFLLLLKVSKSQLDKGKMEIIKLEILSDKCFPRLNKNFKFNFESIFVLKLLSNKSNKNQPETITSWMQNEPVTDVF